MRNDLLPSAALLEQLEKRLEQEAAERQRLADFFNFAPDPCLVTAAGGTIREANQAAAALLGAPAGALSGKLLVGFIAVEARRPFRTQLNRVTTAGDGAAARWRTRLRARRGNALEAELSVRAIRDAANGGLCWLIRPL
jgi:PAS domain S-box-containing protein